MSERFLKDLLTPISSITDKLYIGNREGGHSHPSYIEKIVRISTANDRDGCNYFIDLGDNPKTPHDVLDNIVPQFLEFMKENADRRILIHCDSGCSRSVTFACIWLAHLYKTSGLVALNKIKNKRTCADPNESFINYLKKI